MTRTIDEGLERIGVRMSEHSSGAASGIREGARVVLARLMAGAMLALVLLTGIGSAGLIGQFSQAMSPAGGPAANPITAPATPTPPGDDGDEEEEEEDEDESDDPGGDDSTVTDEEGEETGLGMASLTSSSAMLFSNASSPDSDIDEATREKWNAIAGKADSAGSFLGHTPNGWICGSGDRASTTCSLASLPEDTGEFGSGLPYYAMFGATLNGLGLDNSGAPHPDATPPMQKGAGMLMYALFWIAASVGGIFQIVLSVLKMFNPFNIIVSSIGFLIPGGTSGVASGGMNPVFSGIDALFRALYQWGLGLGFMVTIPLMLLLFVLFILLGKSKGNPQERNKKLKQLGIRIVFMVVGIPILGVLYTSTLDSMSQVVRDGNQGGPAQIVASTFVDFETWAVNTRLHIPEDAVIAWDAENGQPTAEASTSVRGSALAINDMVNEDLNLNGYDVSGSSNLNSSLEGVSSWTLSDVGGRDGFTDLGGSSESVGSFFDPSGLVWGTNMIERYMSGEVVDGAQFSSTWMGGVTTRMHDPEKDLTREDVLSWFDDPYNSASAMESMEDAELDPKDNPVLNTERGLETSMTMQCRMVGQKCYTFSTGAGDMSAVEYPNSQTDVTEGNLSPAATYNYLNTSFAPTQMTVYDPGESANQHSKTYHAAVTTVGGGVMGPMYIVHGIILLGAFSLIGLVYAFGMLFSSIKRTVQLLMAAPLAVIGSLAFISRAILLVFAMTIEVLGTIMLYVLAQYLLAGIPAIIEAPIVLLREGATDPDNPLSGFMGMLSGIAIWPFIGTLVGIIGGIVAIVMSLRMRKTILRGINEVMTNLVNKLIGIEGGSQESQGGGMLGSMMPMAAMAMGMNAGRSGGDGVSGDQDAPDPSAPEGDVGESEGGDQGQIEGSGVDTENVGYGSGGDEYDDGEMPTSDADNEASTAGYLAGGAGAGLATDLDAETPASEDSEAAVDGGDTPVDADINAEGDENESVDQSGGGAGIVPASYGSGEPADVPGEDGTAEGVEAEGAVPAGAVEAGGPSTQSDQTQLDEAGLPVESGEGAPDASASGALGADQEGIAGSGETSGPGTIPVEGDPETGLGQGQQALTPEASNDAEQMQVPGGSGQTTDPVSEQLQSPAGTDPGSEQLQSPAGTGPVTESGPEQMSVPGEGGPSQSEAASGYLPHSGQAPLDAEDRMVSGSVTDSDTGSETPGMNEDAFRGGLQAGAAGLGGLTSGGFLSGLSDTSQQWSQEQGAGQGLGTGQAPVAGGDHGSPERDGFFSQPAPVSSPVSSQPGPAQQSGWGPKDPSSGLSEKEMRDILGGFGDDDEDVPLDDGGNDGGSPAESWPSSNSGDEPPEVRA